MTKFGENLNENRPDCLLLIPNKSGNAWTLGQNDQGVMIGGEFLRFYGIQAVDLPAWEDDDGPEEQKEWHVYSVVVAECPARFGGPGIKLNG